MSTLRELMVLVKFNEVSRPGRCSGPIMADNEREFKLSPGVQAALFSGN